MFARRLFVICVAILALTSAPDRVTADEPTPNSPELAVLNATIYTVDDKQPTAQAFLVRGGRFAAVGSTDEIRRMITAATVVGGETVYQRQP